MKTKVIIDITEEDARTKLKEKILYHIIHSETVMKIYANTFVDKLDLYTLKMYLEYSENRYYNIIINKENKNDRNTKTVG